MTGRMGRAAAVCGALGLLWWATVRLVWAGVGCSDWDCLAPALGTLLAISLVMLAGTAFALERVDVRPGWRAAPATAWAAVAFWAAGKTLPSWPSTAAHAVGAAAVFAASGAVAAFVTGPGPSLWWKVPTALALTGVPVGVLAAAWFGIGG
ncbi:hypothetical protein ACFFV7_20275 [Nonomuraea spiralis]|uniref:Uncharacterized protein n=1 Tax=Nonomuraea spiralis TaxID=46182 RepID=A0ABV5IGD9_9ACTN|nr:hypothetical protein [Nonomuraea spiralis]